MNLRNTEDGEGMDTKAEGKRTAKGEQEMKGTQMLKRMKIGIANRK